jgi:hypothetical protein
MKLHLLVTYLLLSAPSYLLAQNNEFIAVKPGTRVIDYFPFEKRYKYPKFLPGKVFLKNGITKEARLNYNILLGEMQFIYLKDTLNIGNKSDINLITIASDTFYYDNGYLELINNNPSIRIYQKHFIRLHDILKKDAYGVAKSSSHTKSFRDLPFDGNFYKMLVDEELIFQNKVEFYVSAASTKGFLPLKEKTLIKLFPEKSNNIKNYLKSDKPDLNSYDDVIRLAGYISSL